MRSGSEAKEWQGQRHAASCGCHLNYVYANLIILQFAQFIVVQLNLKCVFANTVSLLPATASKEEVDIGDTQQEFKVVA